jgi:hypothetical protein
MRFRWPELLVSLSAAAAAGRLEAQQTKEVGVQGILATSAPMIGVVAAYAGLRISGRTRLSAAVGGGTSDGDFAWRTEILGHFLFNPERVQGWGPYLAGGLAAVGGPVQRGYILLTLGAESRPAGSSGWLAEVGVGGGVRVAVGYRWRGFRVYSRK